MTVTKELILWTVYDSTTGKKYQPSIDKFLYMGPSLVEKN